MTMMKKQNALVYIGPGLYARPISYRARRRDRLGCVFWVWSIVLFALGLVLGHYHIFF